MGKIKVLNKGQKIFALLHSYNNPDYMFPAKGIIKDVLWDPVNPIYLIKLCELYDSFDFIKMNFLDSKFYNTLHGDVNTPKKLQIPIEEFKTTVQLNNHLSTAIDDRYAVVVESIYCFQTKIELFECYNKIHDYLILRSIHYIKEQILRPKYKGMFRASTPGHLTNTIRKAMTEYTKNRDFDVNYFMISIGNNVGTPPIQEPEF